MAKLDTNLQITTGMGDSYEMVMTDQYSEIVRTKQVVNNSDGFTTLITVGSSATGLLSAVGQKMRGAKLIVVKNCSDIPAEIQFKYREWKSDTVDQTNSVDLGPGSATTIRQCSTILAAHEYLVLPSQWWAGYAEDASAANSHTLDGAGYDVDSSLASDSTADVDTATSGDIASDAATTRLYLEPYTSAADCTANLFVEGDLIRIDNEIMEVEGFGSKGSLGTNFMTVKRGVHGSTAATHADDAAVSFPFFNAYHNYNKYTYTQTDSSGKFKSHNLLGVGRSTSYPTGIVKGSFAMKFYESGYQEVGLSGITSNTETGLTASTTYYFKIAVDGGSAYEVAFTTDASNTKFGGNNGVVSKIQTILNTQFYTEGNLFEKGVTCAIVNGDLRFTSHSRTRASAIALTAGTSGTANTDELFDGSNQIARFPAVVKTAVAAKLPDDTLRDKINYTENPNTSVFAYDDGKGNIMGAATGTINYQTGAIDFVGPVNAEFKASANYNSAHSGGINETADQQHVVTNISARSLNQKLNSEVEILGFV